MINCEQHVTIEKNNSYKHMKNLLILTLAACFIFSCKKEEKVMAEVIKQELKTPFVWEGANLYFLLTDRFNNGNPNNDIVLDRTNKTAVLRGFKGGDLQGITQKINEGYFNDLGVNAIWMTPVVEQIHGSVDEGSGVTYGFHGYWTKDWTAIDPNYGTNTDLKVLVETAHKNGIRILLDAVINHTGPVTMKDPVWPNDWVRTGPQCTYKDYESTIPCTLVKNLPDIKTESNEDVSLPPHLVAKWKKEGRYKQEVAELDAFFKRTGHPRAPRFYIIKWLTDYITEYGIDGYRADTVKHVEEHVWQEFRNECDYAFAEWKRNNESLVLDNNDFYLAGEVYNYSISNGKAFDFGDKKVNYFDKAFNSLINFEFKWNAAQKPIEEFFQYYDSALHSNLKNYGVVNYLTSHDDGQPFDRNREKSFEAGTKLLLAPGISQIYYGDELARPINIKEANGDASLRSFMNWEMLSKNVKTQELLSHWQKLGQFRRDHPAVGAGTHHMISKTPYIFYRNYEKNEFKDRVVVGLNLSKGEKVIAVSTVFNDGEKLHDRYSNQNVEVKNGKVTITSEFDIVLLESLLKK